MDNLTVILFLCATVPMVPALYMVPEKKSRLFLGYMLLGMVVCLIASEVNSMLLGLLGGDVRYVSSNVTPIVEEVLKALPVLYYALVFSDERDTLLSISFGMGIGFAILENMVILVGNLSTVSVIWACARGFGAARMHSGCTSLVGNGISYIHKRRKLFYTGTFALMIAAIMAHGLFNMLIQSEYKIAAYIVIVVMYVPHLWTLIKKVLNRWKERKKGRDEGKKEEYTQSAGETAS